MQLGGAHIVKKVKINAKFVSFNHTSQCWLLDFSNTTAFESSWHVHFLKNVFVVKFALMVVT